jgi:polysaccharide biosynthesis protein PslH
MRILFMTQVLPLPLDAGPKVRAYHVIRYLTEAGHDVHLLSFVRAGDSAEHVASLKKLCASVDTVPIVRSRLRDVRDGFQSLFSNTPFLVLRDQVPAMQQTLARTCGATSFDALHADQLWMAPYVMTAASGLTVLDQHNAVSLVPRRLADHQRNPVTRTLLRQEAAKLETFERDACRRFDRVVWVTDEDRRAVVQRGEDRRGRDAVIPIATDPRAQPRVPRAQPFRVTFLGGLHWPPNREGVSWFVDRVWPRIARAVPSAVLTVIGRGGLKGLPPPCEPRRVEVTGYLSDPQPYLAETAAFIVPLRSGAGMRVKILDAWCWGLPVVSTTIGAEGLQAVDRENLLIADAPDAFADAVVETLRNDALAVRLADAGRVTVETTYDWRTVYTAWDGVYGRPRVRPAVPANAGLGGDGHGASGGSGTLAVAAPAS